MKYSLLFFTLVGLSVGLGAADDKSKGIQMPETFISGDPDKGSTLVESCVACHGVDGNSISTDWPKLAGQNQKYLLEELKHFKDGEWNQYRVLAKGSRIQTWINGEMIEDLTDEEIYKTHPKGIIGLQVHGIGKNSGPFTVQWRNIKIKEL